jgi:putative tryptophan/tyrosine transport system substrate-binding protein
LLSQCTSYRCPKNTPARLHAAVPSSIPRLGALAPELVRLPVDLIVARSPLGVRATQQATKSIPIAMSASSDPVRSGFVASLARPGGNITGLVILVDDFGVEQLDFLMPVVPRLARESAMSDQKMMADEERAFFTAHDAAAGTLKVEVHVLGTEKAADLEPAFAAMTSSRIDALLVRLDPHVNGDSFLGG